MGLEIQYYTTKNVTERPVLPNSGRRSKCETRKERFCPKSTLPELSGSEGKTVTNRFDMAATTKPITTTFLRPNLEKKKRIRGQ